MEEIITEAPPKPNPLTTVTPLSKTLALILFMTLPFVGFYLGMRYQGLTTTPPPSNIAPVSLPPKVQLSKLSDQSTASTTDKTDNWKTYTNDKFGFEFKYPENYRLSADQGFSDNDLYAKSPQILAGLVKFDIEKNFLFKVMVDFSQFSVDYLKNYAPTGSENIPPARQTINAKDFYYYGPGGGGVRYPDIYFLSLNNRMLIFSFGGPYENDKTPTLEAKKVQHQILSTFKFLN